VASWSSRKGVCAKGYNRQISGRLDALKAVFYEHLSHSLPPPTLSDREPANLVMRGVGCREEQSADQRRAGSAILLVNAKGCLPCDVPLKRGMEAPLRQADKIYR